jgi:hypothetical protein
VLRVGLIVTIALGAAGAARAAQVEDPRPAQALTACASGDVLRGVALLAELYAETRNPAFVFNQGRCYQQNGQREPAAQRFREYLRVGLDEPVADRQRAEDYINEIDEALLRERVATVPPPLASLPSDPRGPLRLTGFALAGASALALGTGAFLSWRVQSKERQVEARFRDPTKVVDGSDLSRPLRDGGRLETWQYVSYGLGVATLAGAITCFALTGWPWATESQPVSFAPVASPGSLGGLAHLSF